MMMPLEITDGARRVLETDPHGWTLSLISVSVVFIALLILFGIYSLSGAIFTGRFKRRTKPSGIGSETAAAIALALELESGCSDETAAAIAMALELESGASAHDIEPGVVTLHCAAGRPWASAWRNFRKQTNRH